MVRSWKNLETGELAEVVLEACFVREETSNLLRADVLLAWGFGVWDFGKLRGSGRDMVAVLETRNVGHRHRS